MAGKNRFDFNMDMWTHMQSESTMRQTSSCCCVWGVCTLAPSWHMKAYTSTCLCVMKCRWSTSSTVQNGWNCLDTACRAWHADAVTCRGSSVAVLSRSARRHHHSALVVMWWGRLSRLRPAKWRATAWTSKTTWVTWPAWVTAAALVGGHGTESSCTAEARRNSCIAATSTPAGAGAEAAGPCRTTQSEDAIPTSRRDRVRSSRRRGHWISASSAHRRHHPRWTVSSSPASIRRSAADGRCVDWASPPWASRPSAAGYVTCSVSAVRRSVRSSH